MCIFHKWIYVTLHFPDVNFPDYRENYRYCPRCDKWQLIIALSWLNCNMPRMMANIELSDK